ncbi:MAG TPA: FAD-dependent oxidoreductase [Gemmatimonadales bacterium]|jgi:ferredoxin--NADP+ reductase
MSIPPASLRVAIVGAGPAGFYAAEALQKSASGIEIHLFERLPTPFGLVRGGVAPDHPKIKSVTRIFDRIAAQPGFRFFGNVQVGRDITVAELRTHYDAVIYAVGAETDRHLGIPGEDLRGSHAATELVAWYNGHPEFADREFDFSQRAAAVIGIGNVAMDAVRILSRSPDHLATTDLAVHALDAFRSGRLESLHLLSRRGPVQAACTTPELRELGELEGVDVIVDPADVELDPISADHLARDHDRTAENNLGLLRQWAARGSTGAPRRIVFHFCVSPVELIGSDRVEELRAVKNRLVADRHGSVRAEPTDAMIGLPVGLVFRSVGYRGIEIPGLPFDAERGIVPNISGRVVQAPGSATPVRGVYVTGWIKRGPHGIIGTNKSCAAETVDHLLADAVSGRLAPAVHRTEVFDALLAARGIEVVSWSDWQAIDRAEIGRGAPAGRPREKFTDFESMLQVARANR